MQSREIFYPLTALRIGAVESNPAIGYITTRAEIEQRGVSILQAAFLQHEMEKLTRGLEPSELRRSKAGIRHALWHQGIRELAADPTLLNLARRF